MCVGGEVTEVIWSTAHSHQETVEGRAEAPARERAERYGRGREDSSVANRGASLSRTELSGRELTTRVTASVWRELIVSL